MIELVAINDLGDDILEAVGLDEEGNEIHAYGHVSATTNHFDADTYHEDGHRDPDAEPRQMTPIEIGDYARGLLAAHAPAPTADIGFE